MSILPFIANLAFKSFALSYLGGAGYGCRPIVLPTIDICVYRGHYINLVFVGKVNNKVLFLN